MIGHMVGLEICVDDVAGVMAAAQGGADRVELCAALALGGLTPSPALVAAAVAVGIPVHAMMRPVDGGFVYTGAIVDGIADDIARFADLGIAGVVVGALTATGRLDRRALGRWRRAAGTLDLTFHRAIDLTTDPVAAVADAVDVGADHILTSGSAPTAVQGAPTIARMVDAAAGRIAVMAGSGIRPANVAALVEATGVAAVHASASVAVAWADPRIATYGFGGAARRVTDAATIASLRAALDGGSAAS